jgi:hypothetical protein
MGHLEVYLVVFLHFLADFVVILFWQEEFSESKNQLGVSLYIDSTQLTKAMRLLELVVGGSLHLVNGCAVLIHDAQLVTNHVLQSTKGSVIDTEASKVISFQAQELFPYFRLVFHIIINN